MSHNTRRSLFYHTDGIFHLDIGLFYNVYRCFIDIFAYFTLVVGYILVIDAFISHFQHFTHTASVVDGMLASISITLHCTSSTLATKNIL